MKDIRIAIMGAGHIANKFADAVRQSTGCRLAAIASSSHERAEQFAEKYGIPAAYGSYETMLQAEKPDMVYIATVPSFHFEQAMLCVRYGAAVLCEKAMFRNVQEAQTFFDAAEEAGVFAMEAMWSRFLPANAEARSWLREGMIGEPVLAEVSVGFAAPRDPENRYFNAALGGGAALDLTVYGYELLTWMLDAPAETVHVESVRGETGVDVTDTALLRMRGGVPAIVTTSLMTVLSEGVTVRGTKGRIVIPHAHYADSCLLYQGNEEQPMRCYKDTVTTNGFVYELEEALRCIRQGIIESPVVPHADTIACAELLGRMIAEAKA